MPDQAGKKMLRVIGGERLDVPPVWMMRQAGRYLPEYRATRAKAGDFLSLCYTPELAAEVTLQPIRRYAFDAAILFADILLVPQALGSKLWFVQGEGPRLSQIKGAADVAKLNPAESIHETLSPVYETVKILSSELPSEVTLIGFAGAPWTVATYMIAGRGTPDQGPAKEMLRSEPESLQALIDVIVEATILYLSAQIRAGAEIIKLFDSWAGALEGLDYQRFVVAPNRRIVQAIKAEFPHIPIIVFPRGSGKAYSGFAAEVGADCVALDQHIDPEWAAMHVQKDGPVQGNLDPKFLVEGGTALRDEVLRISEAFSGGAHIFNLGHGITPDADPENVNRMLEALRG